MDRNELRRRVIENVEVELELFGGCSESNSVLRLPGVVAAVSPGTPDRSLFNSVSAAGPERLETAIGDLTVAYAEAGVRAWSVWVPDDDRESAALLAEHGHVLDGAPRAMALSLADLRPVAVPTDAEVARGEVAEVGRINDLAYEIEGPAWATTMQCPPDLPFEAMTATIDGLPVAAAMTVDRDDDACVTAVATLPGYRGRGLAGAIVSRLLASAWRRGLRTASLQASRKGAPLYERLGFIDVGFIELWERREE